MTWHTLPQRGNCAQELKNRRKKRGEKKKKKERTIYAESQSLGFNKAQYHLKEKKRIFTLILLCMFQMQSAFDLI